MKIRRKMRQRRGHGGVWALVVAVFATCLIAYGSVQGVLGTVNSWLEDLPSVENSDAFNYAQKTRVYANDQTTLLAEFYIENREPVTIEQVSPYVLEGTVATEDERFYQHNGVDPQGIGRALFVNLQGGELEGASTITMQFVRNTILIEDANEISLKRKVREAQLAINLEEIYSKDEILMMYLNTINYGDGSWGIEAAARNYFQKSALDLSVTEAATLVGIPQSPTYLNPKTNPEACFERRNLVLSRMLSYGTITQEEYDVYILEPLNLNPEPERSIDGIYNYPHFTSYVRELLLDQFSSAEVFKGGLTVYTTIDPNLQNMAITAAQNQYALMSEDFDVSLTAIDPNTGFIKAMIGGKNYDASEYNLATQGERHAGSSFKTFTLIAAIEDGISPDTKIDCSSPIVWDGWRVENYGGASYGVMSIQKATAISSNTGYVRLLQEVGTEPAYETARRMGITSEDLQPLPSATLGAVGVTTLEMASAYSVLASGGIQRDPVAITQIIASDGNLIYQHEDAPNRVLSEDVSYATTKVLRTVFTEGTATAAQLPSGQPAAGKTGTSENWRDSWLCAYTPQLSCAAWIGNPYVEQSMPEYLDCSNVWRDFMSMALADQPIVDFPTKSDPTYTNDYNNKQKELYDPKDPKKAPSVIGKTLDEAAKDLDGYEADYVEEYSGTVPAGVVIRQEIIDGKLILYVSKGPDPAAPDPGTDPTDPSNPTDPGDGSTGTGTGTGTSPPTP